VQQLSGADNVFLISERGSVYNHVATLAIYDVSTAPGGKVRFKDILRHFEERLDRFPLFRRRLAEAPFGLDRPYWVEEADIDVEFHIRHIALPAPGDWRQLMIQVARLHSRPLDRSKPLWEAYIIEGLDNIPKLPPGSFAMFMKLHHASVDGMAGIHLAEQIHSTRPEIEVGAARPRHITVDRPPQAAELLLRAIGSGFRRASVVGKLARRAAAIAVQLGGEAVGVVDGGEMPGLYLPEVPETRFDADVSAHRVVEGFGMPLSRIKRVRRKIPGATLNDVFLAVAGGAVRKYLSDKQELPDRSLVALMPMSLRSSGSGGGNSVGAAMVAVRSDIGDPLERLHAVHEEAQKGKLTAEKLGADLFTVLFEALPGRLLLGTTAFEKLLSSRLNIAVSNVRGPDHPLYLAGAKAMCLYPVSIPTSGAGLNITGVSYNGVMWVSAVSCRSMLPDSGHFLTCMRSAWEELLAAADALPGETESTGAGPGASRRRSRSRSRSRSRRKAPTAP